MICKDSLFNTINKFANYKILVVGDIILDEYIWGKATRLSPEAPVPVLEVNKHTYILGGAANVANNIVSLGGKSILIGVIGEDAQAETLMETLEKSDIDSSFIIKSKGRLTTVKTRLMAHNHQQLARVDREKRDSISDDVEDDIINKISSLINSVDLVLLSDYSKGVLTPSLAKKIIQLAKSSNKPVLVDPKGLDFTKYSGATLITPNRTEAELATKSHSGIDPEILARLISETANIENVLVTLGEDGILFYSGGKIKMLPAVTSEVYDVTGAGDTLISTLALGVSASEGDFELSIILGNYAAGVAVRKTGTTVVCAEELRNIIEHDLMEKTLKK